MDWLFKFPELFKLDTTAVDTTVRSFAVDAEAFLGLIKGGLNSFVGLVWLCLRQVRWPLGAPAGVSAAASCTPRWSPPSASSDCGR